MENEIDKLALRLLTSSACMRFTIEKYKPFESTCLCVKFNTPVVHDSVVVNGMSFAALGTYTCRNTGETINRLEGLYLCNDNHVLDIPFLNGHGAIKLNCTMCATNLVTVVTSPDLKKEGFLKNPAFVSAGDFYCPSCTEKYLH